MPRLSIIIVTYNSRRDVDGSIGSLTSARPAVDHEIVVVDNASPDGTAALVREQWPSARVIDAGRNAGFAAANNLAIRQSRSELVLLLNPDTVVPRGAIDSLVAALDAAADTAIVGPRLVNDAGVAELSFGAMISPLAELKQKVLVTGNDRGWPIARRAVERMTRRAGRVDWVSGACLLIRRTDLEDAGLLDERFFMYTEDVDLCATVRSHGREVRFVPAVEVTHRRGRSVVSAASATRVAYRRAQLAFYEKHHPAWIPLLKMYLKLTGK